MKSANCQESDQTGELSVQFLLDEMGKFDPEYVKKTFRAVGLQPYSVEKENLIFETDEDFAKQIWQAEDKNSEVDYIEYLKNAMFFKQNKSYIVDGNMIVFSENKLDEVRHSQTYLQIIRNAFFTFMHCLQYGQSMFSDSLDSDHKLEVLKNELTKLSKDELLEQLKKLTNKEEGTW